MIEILALSLYSGIPKIVFSLPKFGIPNVPMNSATGPFSLACTITERSSASASMLVSESVPDTLTKSIMPKP